jgi:hypothetical protein
MTPSHSAQISIRGLRYHVREWGNAAAPKLFLASRLDGRLGVFSVHRRRAPSWLVRDRSDTARSGGDTSRGHVPWDTPG